MGATAFPLSGEQYFEELRKAPLIAVPTALLFVGCVAGIVAVWNLSLAGHMPIWAGAIANGVITYWLFSVIHDSAHHSLSRIRWLNELIGGIGLVFLFPYAPMILVRWVHNKHHSHANGAMDPDRFEHEASWWQAPLRWTFFDAAYIHYFLKYGGRVRKSHARSLIAYYSGLAVVVAAAIYLGYGYELLMLWFIPSRITLFLIAVVFVILPHYPALVAQDEEPYMATTMRLGWEWLLTPLLVYQNYHLVHHLYPEIPFYRMHKAYFLKFDEINRENISRQTAFRLTPENIESHRNYDRSRRSAGLSVA